MEGIQRTMVSIFSTCRIYRQDPRILKLPYHVAFFRNTKLSFLFNTPTGVSKSDDNIRNSLCRLVTATKTFWLAITESVVPINLILQIRPSKNLCNYASDLNSVMAPPGVQIRAGFGEFEWSLIINYTTHKSFCVHQPLSSCVINNSSLGDASSHFSRNS